MFPILEIAGLEISTYFLYLSLLFCLMVPSIIFRARSKEYSVLTALDLYMVIMIGAFFGARLFYVLYQEPAYYFSRPLEVLQFWRGGFIFFGGFLGALFASSSFLYFRKESFLKWANFTAPLASLGYALGRISCFLAGCCYGHSSELPWAIFLHGSHRHPTQLYAVGFELCIYVLLRCLEKSRPNINLFFVWLVGHGFGRVLMEYFRADPRGDLVLGVSVSTFISFLLIGAGVFGLVKFYRK